MDSTVSFRVAAAVTVMEALFSWSAPASAQENPAPPAQTPSQAPAGTPSPPPRPQDRQIPPSQPAEQDHQADNQSGDRRFVFHRIENGVLRLDMRTGAVTACTQDGGWKCAPARDDRAALDRQIAQLQHDNAILKNAMLEHGVPLPAGMAAPAPGAPAGDETIPRPPQTVPPTAAPGPPAQGASSGDETGSVVGAVEKGWRRLVEIMTNIQRDWQKKD